MQRLLIFLVLREIETQNNKQMKKSISFLGNKKTILLVFLASLLISPAVFAQKEKREISDFTEIGFSLPGQLEIIQGSKVSLAIEGSKEDLEKIISKVDGDQLKIYRRNNHASGLGDVKVFVTVVKLNKLSIAGSGDVIFKSKLITGELEISLSGSGDIQCADLAADELEINIAGSGDIVLGGIAKEELEINIAGSGDVKAENLETKMAEVNIAGSETAKVWASEELETNIVGSGDVYYKGKPLVNAETMGSGSTKSID